ncbi:cytochrome c oxidase subunit II [Phyllobacterium bourgognense]|uniref:Cytochrome aa3 subunit 2 n=1 Tax=Phyllobacterium bourgognense TaxID=314236 RepID=A0A368YN03_9HYPH|nr:cytochrome c oxidase subunit 2 [Phyllobacterium bourgognense]
MKMGGVCKIAVVCLFGFGLQGCSGERSALDPAGKEAEELAKLFWIMLSGAGIVWLFVLLATFAAVRFPSSTFAGIRPGLFIFISGVIFPTICLGGLLVHSLRLLPGARDAKADMIVKVSGEQWWWRVSYMSPGGEDVVSANEIRIPSDATVEFELTSPDIIHSFWIPVLGGKMDMIPGRTNHLRLHPEKAGVYRGVCAEYCGTSHALMGFPVVVQTQAEFDAWLKLEKSDAVPPGSPAAINGERLFMSTGCRACHTVRGTEARGQIGPDLTHFGGRKTVGAGILANTSANVEKWLRDTGKVKPAVRMPEFNMLHSGETRDLAAYLTGLK